VNIRLDARTLAGISVDRVDESGHAVNHIMTDIQRPLPVGIGYGYRVHAESGALASGDLQYQGPFGRYEQRRDITDGLASTTLSASGGIVAINRGLYATRPIQDAFALVRVPDVEGVRAYVNNQEVGRTDKRGDVLVPSLLSYYGNVLDISDQDVPLERTVGSVRKTVAPPYHGGALAVFPLQRVQSARGTIQIDQRGSLLTPAYGQLIVKYCSSGPCARDAANGTAATLESPIGEGGEFYLENVPPGRHEAIVEFSGASAPRRCLFTLDMPASSASSVALGALRCVMRE
jgi:outer membrane usher protein